MCNPADAALVESNEMEDFQSQFTKRRRRYVYNFEESGRTGRSGPFSNTFLFTKQCKQC